MVKRSFQIAHIMPWSSIGGTEHATFRLAQALRDRDYEHTVFCPDLAAPVSAMFRDADFETSAYATVEPSYRHPRAFVASSVALSRELKRRAIDLVHCADLLAGYYAAVAGKLARLPVLCHVRCSYPDISWRDKTFLKAIDHFVFVSNDARSTFAFKIANDRAAVIYDGIDVPDRATLEDAADVRGEFGIGPDTTIVGMVARIAPAKDFSTLIRSAQKIVANTPDVRFLLVGDHSTVDLNRRHFVEVQQMIYAAGLSPYFTFTGHRDDVERLLTAMDIFVLSTTTEGLPLVILEAMAYGKPVVATAVGGVPELVRDQQTGFLHAPGDHEQQAAHLSSLILDHALRRKLGEAGRAVVRAQFSRQQFATQISNLYSKLIGKRASSRAFLQTNNSVKEAGRHV